MLSGGEKARVALARTLLSEANFMLLDEPTNHLDMRSINILTQALQKYQGTFVVVSHDRYFVSKIANKIWWLEEGKIKEYPGTYEEYEYWKAKQEELKKLAYANKPTLPKTNSSKKDETALDTKNTDTEIKKLKKEFAEIENKISSLKNEIQLIQQQYTLNDVITDATKMKELNVKYDAFKQDLNATEVEYERLFEKILSIEN